MFGKNFAIFLASSLFLLMGCGYKPSSYYTEEVLGSKIYASVLTSIEEPETSILIEDALKDALRVRLNVSFSNKNDADSFLQLSIKRLEFKPLQTDGGYTVLYRSELILKAQFTFIKNGVKEIINYDLEGFYEFPVRSNASLSVALKLEAVKISALKALDTLIPKLALRGSMEVDNKK